MEEQGRGHEIAIDETHPILRVRLWGFWDKTIAQNMQREFKQQVHTLNAAGKTWYVLTDMTKFPPQSQEVQAILSQLMAFAKQQGMQKAARIITSTLTKLQIARLSRETQLPQHSFFQSEADAIAWLLAED
jgi:hypothetical protein